MKSEIRKSYFMNKYAIITPGREKRPRDFIEQSIDKTRHEESCIFCPNNLDKKYLIKTYGKNKKRWELAALKNKYPSVSPDNKQAYGIQEVIIDTPDHRADFASLPVNKIVAYLNVLADRLKKISKNKKVEYILQFKNNGSKAGATIKHAHSQIFATAILPYDVYDELELAEKYKTENGNCPYCDTLAKELISPRKIFQDKHVGAFTPLASEYHYEAWIFPLRHTDNIATLNKQEINSLAKALKLIVSTVDKLGLAYNFFMHQVVSRADQHFYIKVQPRDTNVWAGVELGSGLVINSISPERAAAYYRKNIY